MNKEYPKALYRGADADKCLGDAVTVPDAEQEAAARADGYEMYAEIHARESGAQPAKTDGRKTRYTKAQ